MKLFGVIERDGQWWFNAGHITYIEIEGDTIYINFPYARRAIRVDDGRAVEAMNELADHLVGGFETIRGVVFLAKKYQTEEPRF